ncbi:MAG: carbon dioxide concentrating mechanism protein [Cyanobacteriota bacterium]|nr:carbon dioxide concentrating mechanism protein [Cyanobacteriota bacterium]
MYRSPPQSLNNDFCTSGDVTIDPSAAIATGVILQAEPDSEIVIATGVCIGMGVIIHAYQGKIEIEAGATIGAGVLVVGHGTIGAKACIGAETTLLNPAIAAKQMVPTGILMGDESRSVSLDSNLNEDPDTLDEDADSTQVEPSPTDSVKEESAQASEADSETSSVPDIASTNSHQLSPNPPTTIVYGQVHLNHLLNTLLPHRKSLNNSNQSDRSP